MRVKMNIIRMYKIDFFPFFVSYCTRNLSYTKISQTLKKNYPRVRAFSVTMKNFCKENNLLSRFSQSDINEMVRTTQV